MKIVQITAAVENQIIDGEMQPYTDATVYGLSDDNKVYYWDKKDDGTFGWKLSGTE